MGQMGTKLSHDKAHKSKRRSLDKEFEAKQKQRRASKMALEEQWKGNRDIHQPASSSTSGGFFSRIFRSSSDDGSAKRKRSSARLAKLADEKKSRDAALKKDRQVENRKASQNFVSSKRSSKTPPRQSKLGEVLARNKV
ncbi:hypothetical protein TrCOL_g125 [Triparma columacea]|uniref:Uncharacterized protein n=1 Tax=Triparma columacea TaxID=722753 RepID=A0A9W7GD76_9STRA|nr:hypothetical protein TrCOL_g125 [Triparma columacea]